MSSFKSKDNIKKIQEVEIKTVIQLHSKADNLDYCSLNKILTSEPITKEIANIVLKKILANSNILTGEAVKTLQLLISLGANFDLLEDGDGCTALMNACSKGSEEVAEFIIQECPEQLNKTSKQQRNCLFFSINSPNAQGNIELIQKLLKAGVNPNHRENLHGDSSLSLAVKNGYLKITALLLQFGADPNIFLGSNHHTLLHIVCENLKIDMLSILLANRANPFTRNSEGELPIEILYRKLTNSSLSQQDFAVSTLMIQLLSKISEPDPDQIHINCNSPKLLINSTNDPMQSTEMSIKSNSFKINIKEIRNELLSTKSKISIDIEDIYTLGFSSNKKKQVASQILKFGNNEISPIPNTNDKNRCRDIISVPISADFSSNEICKKIYNL